MECQTGGRRIDWKGEAREHTYLGRDEVTLPICRWSGSNACWMIRTHPSTGKKARRFLTQPKDYGKPWFGRLMAGSQMLTCFLQIDYWIEFCLYGKTSKFKNKNRLSEIEMFQRAYSLYGDVKINMRIF